MSEVAHKKNKKTKEIKNEELTFPSRPVIAGKDPPTYSWQAGSLKR